MSECLIRAYSIIICFIRHSSSPRLFYELVEVVGGYFCAVDLIRTVEFIKIIIFLPFTNEADEEEDEAE